ncbi:copper chaperone PCu(A)C [Methylobacterium sp. Leaf118]|uniref:copper chaperone PCu(A)C n=1 Tax=Methylobacterium sp. Leaf118 TaxID=2876562 RepID=UPI001E423BE8|nr:copper chaperone PCu(A)C [Methylobacterium sp. Leaf118]
MRPTASALAALLLALGLAAGPAQAHDYAAGALKIGHPWSRATPGGARVAAGYLTVTNTGSTPDRLTGGSLAAAGRTEVHTMSVEKGVMRMAPLPNGLEIPPGGTITLAPSGHHLMFMDLKTPLKQGERAAGTLTFERAGTVPVEFVVESIAAKGGGQGAGKGDKGHAGHDHAH